MADTEAKWYILHTYSGYENKVANDIMKVVENRNLQNVIEEVYLPVEMTKQTKENGKEVEVEEKLFPSYVFVKMIITNESWYICRKRRYRFRRSRVTAYSSERRRGQEPRYY